jgi:sugar phosphate permease
MKAVSTWFPAKERGLAGGVFNIGASMGSVLAPPLVAWSILLWNWRAAFLVAGAWAWSGWCCGCSPTSRPTSTRRCRTPSAT